MNNLYAKVSDYYDIPLRMSIQRGDVSTNIGSTHDPEIFGPSFWFTLHNGATNYANLPTDFVKNGMKSLLINLPLLVPCINCREHFYAFLTRCNLDLAVSSRDQLFEFFNDIHNYVNSRYGKPSMSLEDAKRLYGFNNNGTLMKISYS